MCQIAILLRKRAISERSGCLETGCTLKITFGRSSERVEGPTLFDGLDPEPDPTPAIVVEAAPEAEAPERKRKGHGRRRKPADLPRRPEVIDLSDAEKVCACCGTAKLRIGQTVNERLDYQPMAIFVRELIRPVYACRSCESQGHDPQIAKAVLPPEPLPKSNIGAGLLAHVIVSKMCDHLPLNRQESILARHGWDVRRSTLCDHLEKCGLLLKPLYDLMHRRLLQSFAVHADDTPLLLLRPRRTAYAWVYFGDAANPYTPLRLHRRPESELPADVPRRLQGFRPRRCLRRLQRGAQQRSASRLLDACPSIFRGGRAERPTGGRGARLHPHPLRRREGTQGRTGATRRAVHE